MNSNLKGNIGESETVAYFIREGYEVYLPFGTAAKCDLIIVKNNIVQRVSVKSTASKQKSGNYRVKIRQGKMNCLTPFNIYSSDILFIYIIPEGRFHILQSKDIKTQFEITVK